MAKHRYREINFKPATRRLIHQCNEIIGVYQAQGLTLTARQLYYQLVTRNIIPNQEKSYKLLTKTVSDGRLAGLIDWDAIEDRARAARFVGEWDSISQLVDGVCDGFRLPRWADQENYVELWVEKDALAGVLRPIAVRHHVVLMVNRGYSSQSAMYESAQRFIDANKPGVLFYLGDHDPSGEDMVRDIRERLEMFGVEELTVRKLALTMPQIQQYNPPPNPAKITDPRAAMYIQQHGQHSWEVDALPPEVLTQIITTAFDGVMDRDLYNAVIEREQAQIRRLRTFLKQIT